MLIHDLFRGFGREGTISERVAVRHERGVPEPSMRFRENTKSQVASTKAGRVGRVRRISLAPGKGKGREYVRCFVTRVIEKDAECVGRGGIQEDMIP